LNDHELMQLSFGINLMALFFGLVRFETPFAVQIGIEVAVVTSHGTQIPHNGNAVHLLLDDVSILFLRVPCFVLAALIVV